MRQSSPRYALAVPQEATSVAVEGASAALAPSASEVLTAVAYDQFGMPMSTLPSFTWTLAPGNTGSLQSIGINSATYSASQFGEFGAGGVSATVASGLGSGATGSGPVVPTIPRPSIGSLTASGSGRDYVRRRV